MLETDAPLSLRPVVMALTLPEVWQRFRAVCQIAARRGMNATEWVDWNRLVDRQRD